MNTDPISDAWALLSGATGDLAALGTWRWLLVLALWALLIGGVAVAVAAWRRFADQRRASALLTAVLRGAIGVMWFQGSLWKLPFPVSGGLQYWTGQMVDNAAYPFVGALVRDLALPHMAVVDPLVWALELGLAVSYVLGLFVRITAPVGALYVLGLWLGLYRQPSEWPWEYVFLAVVQAQFALADAGRCLGLDRLRVRAG